MALLGQGCAAAPPSRVVAPVPISCGVAPASTLPESLAIATTSSAVAERFVFAHLYETLVRADCEGRVFPGLARAWTADATGRNWTFILRRDARFWNGDRLTARDVVAAWRETADSADGPAATARIVEASVVDDSTLVVSLPDSEPILLADPVLAIHRGNGLAWPEGTGSYRPGDVVTPGRVEMVPVIPGSMPRLSVQSVTEGGSRDAIDAGVDLLLTADPAAVGYAAARAELVAVPLPWTHSYVLLLPGGRSADADETSLEDQVSALRVALASDAVRVEARPAEQPSWWAHIDRCAPPPASDAAVTGSERGTRLVYRREDRVARALAERLVALTSIGAGSRAADVGLPPELLAAGGRATAAGLSPADFASALRAGRELAYVLDLPSRSLAPCREAEKLFAAAPWLAADSSDSALPLVPLIETRDRAILRRDRLSLTADWDGAVRITARRPLP